MPDLSHTTGSLIANSMQQNFIHDNRNYLHKAELTEDSVPVTGTVASLTWSVLTEILENFKKFQQTFHLVHLSF